MEIKRIKNINQNIPIELDDEIKMIFFSELEIGLNNGRSMYQ